MAAARVSSSAQGKASQIPFIPKIRDSKSAAGTSRTIPLPAERRKEGRPLPAAASSETAAIFSPAGKNPVK